ncbi:hypothetical protein HDU67_004843, partial [Dinochytrium kinnereticum]
QPYHEQTQSSEKRREFKPPPRTTKDLQLSEMVLGLSIVEPILQDKLQQMMRYAEEAKQAYQDSLSMAKRSQDELYGSLNLAREEFCK